MRSEQFRAVFRSLRFRLTAWNTAVVLLTVLLGAVRRPRRTATEPDATKLEKSLVADAMEIGLAVEQLQPDLDAGRFKK